MIFFYNVHYIQTLSFTNLFTLQYPELSVASYNKNPAALNEPDGIVAVWNLHMLERAEFVFHSQVSAHALSQSMYNHG